MKNLLNQLESIRSEKTFIKYGFAEKGGHLPIIQKLKKLSKSENNLISIKAKLLVYLAYGYASSRGLETDEIKKIKEELKEIGAF